MKKDSNIDSEKIFKGFFSRLNSKDNPSNQNIRINNILKEVNSNRSKKQMDWKSFIFGTPAQKYRWKPAFSVIAIVLISATTVVYFTIFSRIATNKTDESSIIVEEKARTKTKDNPITSNHTILSQEEQTFDSMILSFKNRSFSNETSTNISQSKDKKFAFSIIKNELVNNGIDIATESDESMITKEFVFQENTLFFKSHLKIVIDKADDNKIKFDISKQKIDSKIESNKLTITDKKLKSIINNIKDKYHN